MQEYDQPTKAPVPKVQAVATSGTIITAIVTALAAFGVIIPDNISGAAKGGIAAAMIVISALQTIITFLAGYFKRDVKPAAAVKVIQGAK